ncbi:MAG: amidohydrolase [Myxococcales bacterium]|nr:amidohydrolase [Myxococcales bacterium]
MADFPTRFDSTLDLARLPWFDRVGNELVLADESIGPTVDVHTHLALSFIVPQRVDLGREHAVTEHYLPVERRLDLDVYANRNFSPTDMKRLERDLAFGSFKSGGMRRTHTVPNLEREMRGLGVVRSVLLAIDFPVLSDNAGDWLKAAKGHDDLVVFGSVHPYRPGMEKELLRQIALGARGIKVHPAVQTVLPGDPRAMKLYGLCGKHRLPVLFHCGPVDIETRLGRRLSQVRHYFRPIEKNPDTTFVLGHSGALQLELGLEIARRYPNVYLEISSQSLSNVRKILDSADPERVMFGSDWPFYHQAIPLAKLLIASVGREELRSKVLHENAARLLGLDPKTLRAGHRPVI